MPWTSIDTQSELEALNRSICWDDSTRLELSATSTLAPELPTDVNRSGYVRRNYYVLIRDRCIRRALIEFTFMHVDRIGAEFLERFTLLGRVDGLKRVELTNYKGEVLLQCARLAWRVATFDPNQGGYFERQWNRRPADE